MTEEKLPEQTVEVEKKKSNKALIIINIAALVVITGIVVYYFFFFNKKNDLGPVRGFVAEEFSSDDFCERWQERQDNMGDRKPPEGADVPDDMGDRMEEQNSLMEEICADGEVSEEEQEQLEDMRGGFSGPGRINNFNQE